MSLSGERGCIRGDQGGTKRRAVIHKSSCLAGFSSLLVASTFLTTPSLAQTGTSASDPTVQLDTVDVQRKKAQTATGPIDGYVATQSAVGTKTSTPIAETPQAISVVGAKQINDQQAQSIDTALRYSPGVRSQTFGTDYRGDWFLLRGFEAEQTGYYLDGLQLFSSGFSTFKVDAWDAERIDILRGPTATLYGGGTPGGIVNVVSKLPTFANFGVVEAGVNEFGNAYGAVDVGGVAGANNEWSYRYVSLGRDGGTEINHVNNERELIAPSLSYRPDGATELTLLGSYMHTDTKSPNFLPYQGTVTAAPFGRIPRSLFTSDPSIDMVSESQGLIGYQFEHAFAANAIFRQNVRYGENDNKYHSLYGLGYDSPPTATEALLSRGNFIAHDSAHTLQADNQGEFRFGTGPVDHTLLLGLDYKHLVEKGDEGFEMGPSLDLLNPVYGPQAPVNSRYNIAITSQDQLGVYAQDQMKIGRFSFVMSGRHDWVKTALDNEQSSDLNASRTEGKFSGRVGAIYNFDSGLAPYVSYATSFNPIVGQNASESLFRSETGEQEEVGLKYVSPTMPFTASVALFNLTRDNVPTTDPNNIFFQIQTGQQRSRGIEAEATANLTDGLSLIAAYTAYQLQITKDTDPTLINKVPTNIPQQFGSLWLDYTLQGGTFQGLGFAAGVRYVGHSYVDQANTLVVPAVVLGDLAVHYDRGHWRAAVNVSNLADDRFVASCQTSSACFYGEGRRTTVSVAYKW